MRAPLALWALGIGLLFNTSAPAKISPTLSELMGINGHTVLFKPELCRTVCHQVRDYHPLSWDVGKTWTQQPKFPHAVNRVNWDTVYGSWKKAGWDVNACIQIESVPSKVWEVGPLEQNARAYGAAFARHFGPGSPNPLVGAVEIGNEPGSFSDDTYRKIFTAMAGAIRDTDPKMKIATCAITPGTSHAYAKSLSCVKGLETLYDILNIHVYAQVEGWPTWRRSFPEDPKISYLQEVDTLIRWRDNNAPAKEIWITEFGWDATTRKPDPNTEFKKWETSTEAQQAQWLVRSFLLWASMDVDRAYVYFFNDADEPQVHGSSGITRNFRPKPAFHALERLYAVLGDYRFAQKALEKTGDIYAYDFVSSKNPRRHILAVWSPTGNGRSLEKTIPWHGPAPVRVERLVPDKTEKAAPPKLTASGLTLRVDEYVTCLEYETAPR